ncbi:MAG: aminotransferase class IV [Rhodospirillaceae bacterium]|nr:aminotransferase class IV [Rhodospirillales bacterium]
MLCYWNGQFVPKEAIAVSPDDRGFLFADGLYEVVRAYEGRFFRMAEHLTRLTDGASAIRLDRTDFAELEAVGERLLNENGLESGDATFYIQVTRGVAARTHAFPPAGTPPTVFATVKRFTPTPSKQDHGVKAITLPDERWLHCSIKTTALTWNVLSNQRAKEAGAEEAVFFRNGHLTEGTHTNVMAVVDGVLVTPPLNNLILPGVTRKAVLELAAADGIDFAERNLTREEFDDASEIVIIGTTMEITPVIEVEDRLVGIGEPGPVTRRLQSLFRQLTR